MSGSDRLAARLKGLARALWIPLFFAQAAAWAQVSSQDSIVNPISLAEGIPWTSEPQKASDSITYLFKAAQGGTYLIQVDQDGLDFIVTVRSPDGATRSFNSPLFRDEADFVLVEDALDGDYWITIDSDESSDALGTHTVTVLRSTDRADDPSRAEAWHLMSEAAAENAEGSRENGENALNQYQAASKIWGELGDSRRQAQSLYSAGMLQYWLLDNWVGAAELAAVAAEIYQGLNEQSLFANSVFLRAYALIEVAGEPETVEDERRRDVRELPVHRS